MKNKCVIYVRVASFMISNPSEAIDAQILFCKGLAKSAHLEVDKIFESIGISSVENIDEILAYCKANEIKTIIAKDITRLSRFPERFVEAFEKIENEGIMLLTGSGELSDAQLQLLKMSLIPKAS